MSMTLKTTTTKTTKPSGAGRGARD